MNTAEKFSLFEVAEIELTYKSNVKPKDRPHIERSIDSFEILINNWDENKIEFFEQAKVLLLNRSHRVLGIREVSAGGVTGTVVDPKLIYVAALKANSCSIVLAHNHPSGNLQPSQADKLLTEKIREGGKLLDIIMLDHLIITNDGYYSFADGQAYTADELVKTYPERNLRLSPPF